MPKKRFAYIKSQEDIGVTKHLGGPEATEELIKACRIKSKDRVLDAGCGIGLTTIRLAKKHDCKATGIDISEKLIGWARKNAGKLKNAEFMVADVRKLPFKNNTFDAVICESVLAFIPDKKKPLSELVRVVKPGGYIGMNETVWLKPPPGEILRYFKIVEEYVGLLSPGQWMKLLEQAGLEDRRIKSHKISAWKDFTDRVRLLGVWRVLKGLFKGITTPEYRNFVKNALGKKAPKNLYDYYGYAVFWGRKKRSRQPHNLP